MGLRVAYLYLEKTLRHGVHFFNLIGYSEVTARVYGSLHARHGKQVRTVCSRPPMRGSSKTVLRANGETVAMLVMMVRGQDGGCAGPPTGTLV
jgi:hypothetical protein